MLRRKQHISLHYRHLRNPLCRHSAVYSLPPSLPGTCSEQLSFALLHVHMLTVTDGAPASGIGFSIRLKWKEKEKKKSRNLVLFAYPVGVSRVRLRQRRKTLPSSPPCKYQADTWNWFAAFIEKCSVKKNDTNYCLYCHVISIKIYLD